MFFVWLLVVEVLEPVEGWGVGVQEVAFVACSAGASLLD